MEKDKKISGKIETTGRNAPCPCGSGKKYKRCCAGGRGATGKGHLYLWVLGGVLLLGLIWFGFQRQGLNGPGFRGGQPGFVAPDRQGQPWEFDAETNTHWDPTHGHWHQGPPPSNQSASDGLEKEKMK